MSKLIIEGGKPLIGEVEPTCNKNSVLKLIAASILFNGDYVLTNVHPITDITVMLEVLSYLGAKVDYNAEQKRVVINTDNITNTDIPRHLANKIRASVMFIGPLLARFGKVSAVFPGGDKIGPRELKAHFSGFTQMGAMLEGNEWDSFTLSGKLRGAEIWLYEPSVTATENVILAAALIEGTTIIKGAACEPHVQELCLWLAECGVEVSGVGSSVLHITGRSELSTGGKEHAVWPDYIDVATMGVAAAITNGAITIKNVRIEDLKTIEFFYSQLNFTWEYRGNDLFVKGGQDLKVVDPLWARIKGFYSQPWYGFPTDLMSLTIVLAMYAKGSVLFFEKMYPGRMALVSYFNAAGANIFESDPHRIMVNGPTMLKGFKYVAPDLRAGMAFLLAGLASNGVSEVQGAEHIARGYPDVISRFQRLGASITVAD